MLLIFRQTSLLAEKIGLSYRTILESLQALQRVLWFENLSLKYNFARFYIVHRPPKYGRSINDEYFLLIVAKKVVALLLS